MRWLAVLLVSALFAGCADKGPGEPPTVVAAATMEDGSPLETLWAVTTENVGTVYPKIRIDATGTSDPDGDLSLILTEFSTPNINHSSLSRLCGSLDECAADSLVQSFLVHPGMETVTIIAFDEEINRDMVTLQFSTALEFRFEPLQFEGPTNGPDPSDCSDEETAQHGIKDLFVPGYPSPPPLRVWVEEGNADFVLCMESGAVTEVTSDEILFDGPFPTGDNRNSYWISVSHRATASDPLATNAVEMRAEAIYS